MSRIRGVSFCLPIERRIITMGKIYFDFDGVLASYYWGEDYEQRVSALKPEPMVQVARALAKAGYSVGVCSAVATASEERQKRLWLAKNLPEVTDLFFPARGTNKSKFMRSHEDDILVDDFSKNLHEWAGVGVKYLNGINNTHGSWLRGGGLYLSRVMDPRFMAAGLARLSKAIESR